MRLLFLLAALLLPIAVPSLAVAQWVDSYGNSPPYGSGYTTPPGEYGYRDSKGTLHYPPARSPRQDTWSSPTPTYQPAPPSPPRQERYEMLRDTTPGSSYSDSLFRDRVRPRRE